MQKNEGSVEYVICETCNGTGEIIARVYADETVMQICWKCLGKKVLLKKTSTEYRAISEESECLHNYQPIVSAVSIDFDKPEEILLRCTKCGYYTSLKKHGL